MLPVFANGYAAAGLLLAIAGLITRRFERTPICFLGLSLMLTGVAWAQMFHQYTRANSVVLRITEEPSLVRFRGIVAEQPSIHRGVLESSTAIAVRVDLTGIEDHGTWSAITGRVLLRIEPSGSIELSPGQEITGIGEISRIGPPMNPGEYDWQSHFAREGLFARLSVHRVKTLQVVNDGRPNLLWRARGLVRQALASGFKTDENRALATALLFGDSDDSLEQAWADFRASGTAHHLSISGTHIAILTAFVLLVARCLMLHPRTALITCLVFAVCYASLAHPSPPITRSVLLCIAVGLALLLRRNTDPLQCLCAAVLLMLIYNPMDLFAPGFQLSFGAVAALMLFARPLATWFWSFENEHDRIARQVRPPHGVAAARQWLVRALVQGIAAGLVAYSVTLPLVAIHFRQLNPWAIPGSLILGPVVGMSLVTGLLKTIVCVVTPAAAGVAAIPCELSVGLMRWSVRLLAKLPGAEIGFAGVRAWMVVAYFVLLLAPLAPYVCRWRFRWLLPSCAVLLFCLSPVLLAARDPGLRITLLSVGNASCTVIEMPDGRTALVDCGAARGRDLFAQTLQPFMRERGIRRIDDVFITHSDTDHTLALDDVVAACHPAVYRESPLGMLAGPGAVSWTVLAPVRHQHKSDNDESTVLQLSYAGRTVLFTGDIEEAGIGNLLRTSTRLACDVLIAPHHGSSELNTPALLSSTRPQLIVCSSSPRLTGAQLRFEQFAHSYAVKRTGSSGAITLTISPDGKLEAHGYRDRN